MADEGDFPKKQERADSAFKMEQPMALRAQSGSIQVSLVVLLNATSLIPAWQAQGWLYKRAPRVSDKDKDKSTRRIISSFGKSVKGVFNKNAHYQRRWCCIEGDVLSYYKSEVCQSDPMDLLGCCAQVWQRHMFRTHRLRCPVPPLAQ